MDFWHLDATPQGFRGDCVDGIAGRAFGGHTLAHSITAAALAAEETTIPSSLHALFIAPGDPNSSVDFTPKILKKGRSLANVRVEAHQSGRQILESIVTFHRHEPSVTFQSPPPNVPGPDQLPTESPNVHKARTPFEIRHVPLPDGSRSSQTWIRLRDTFGSRPDFMHATMLTYAIDFLISWPGRTLLPDEAEYAGASLDHAMWFHRPFRIDEWLLVQGATAGYAGSRALCTSAIFSAQGDLVATANQEVLFRLNP